MDGWTIVGAIAGIIGALAAIAAVIVAVVAARYAKQSIVQGQHSQETAQQALEQGQRSQEIADDRYERDIVPRPRLVGIERTQQRHLYLGELLNAGGAAVYCVLLVHRNDEVLLGAVTLPSHGSAKMRLSYRFTVAARIEHPNILILAAQDVQENWWDCLRVRRINNFDQWWKAQFDSLGLDEIPIRVGSFRDDE